MKVARWEKIVMVLGAVLTVCVLWYFKTTNDRALRRHDEVMSRVAGRDVGLLDTGRDYYQLLLKIDPENKAILDLLSPKREVRKAGDAYLRAHWSQDDARKLIDLVPMVRSRAQRAQAVDLLQSKTGQQFSDDLCKWQSWLWRQAEPADNTSYANFRAILFHQIDPLFLKTFAGHPRAAVRMDEIQWSGIRKDTVPELCNPAVCEAKDAGFLKDDDIVIGFCDRLAARCYPMRIVWWHQIIEDIVGEHNITVAYCTISGAAGIYNNIPGDQTYQFTNSGFMYRSNQLMQDHNTNSLWSTEDGCALLGRAAEQKQRLPPLPMVITTWAEWRRRHPDTTVLSINTGFERDYNGPDLYVKYRADDKLFFTVLAEDKRLPNKETVLIPRPQPLVGPAPLAISQTLLRQNRLYPTIASGKPIVILTDKSGASRIYTVPPGQKFASFDGDSILKDESGRTWSVGEERLVLSGAEKQVLSGADKVVLSGAEKLVLSGADKLVLSGEKGSAVKTAGLSPASGGDFCRLPATSSFWFSWYDAHPDTKLAK